MRVIPLAPPASPPAEATVEAAPSTVLPAPTAARNGHRAKPFEIVAPDRACAALLLEYAAPLCPVGIVAGPGWIVRLEPPSGPGWVPEVLALLARWLESAGLPCATAAYNGRRYLILGSTDVGRTVEVPDPDFVPDHWTRAGTTLRRPLEPL